MIIIGPIFDALILLVVTLMAATYLIFPGLSAASTPKNLGALVLIAVLVALWGVFLGSVSKGQR